jgi:hypothetical protein
MNWRSMAAVEDHTEKHGRGYLLAAELGCIMIRLNHCHVREGNKLLQKDPDSTLVATAD